MVLRFAQNHKNNKIFTEFARNRKENYHCSMSINEYGFRNWKHPKRIASSTNKELKIHFIYVKYVDECFRYPHAVNKKNAGSMIPAFFLLTNRLQPCCFTQCIGLICLFPREIIIFPSKMAVGSCFLINRSAQIQITDNRTRSQIEIGMNDFRDFFV